MINSLPIGFPGLGIELDFKNYFTVFGYAIYWYAVIICIGLLVAYLYADKRAYQFNISSNTLLDGLLFTVPIAIVGARLFYVFFAPPGEINTLMDIIDVRNGGLSIYGALIATGIFLVFFCKKKKLLLANVLDLVSLGFLIGQSIGRWGNFVNREVYGVETTLPWGMSIDGVTYHPLFLYESLWNIIGFIILHKLSKNRKFPGQIALMYMLWYGLGRGLMEGLRVQQYVLVMGDLAVSQLVSFGFALIALYMLIIRFIDIKKGVVYSFEYVDPKVKAEEKKAEAKEEAIQTEATTEEKVEKATKKEKPKSDYVPMYGYDPKAMAEEMDGKENE